MTDSKFTCSAPQWAISEYLNPRTTTPDGADITKAEASAWAIEAFCAYKAAIVAADAAAFAASCTLNLPQFDNEHRKKLFEEEKLAVISEEDEYEDDYEAETSENDEADAGSLHEVPEDLSEENDVDFVDTYQLPPAPPDTEARADGGWGGGGWRFLFGSSVAQ